ncbi:DNA-processing protein DprA, partial [Devosia sp.]|uniref:DNA-processing protein DprA n=1 Tax=Devosia sp. TaxID=1871048 RepID=UPI002FC9890C
MAPLPGAALTDAQRIAWLRLVRSDNVGPATFRQLLNRFASAEAALEALPSLLKRTGKPLRVTSQAAAEDEIAGLSRYGARLVAGGEADYPELLNYIPAAPPLITMAGGANLDWQRAVGIVGARNASAAGIKMTRMLAGD